MSKTIVCFGDSNTYGYNSSIQGRFNENERWTCLLDDLLGDEYLIKEEGLCGRTTVFDDPLHEGMSGLDSIMYAIRCHEPVDLLIIMLGTNDVKERYNVNAENIAKGLYRLIQKTYSIPKLFYHIKILVIAPPPIEEGYNQVVHVNNEMGKGCIKKSQELAYYYQELANQIGVYFLDAGSIEGVGMYSSDHMHFDIESHKKFAQALAMIIPEIC